MRRRESRITLEDASRLCAYIYKETGYSEAKINALLDDYSKEILQRGPNLPTQRLLKLRNKWGLSGSVGGVAWALAAGAVGALHVWIKIHEEAGQMEVLAD